MEDYYWAVNASCPDGELCKINRAGKPVGIEP